MIDKHEMLKGTLVSILGDILRQVRKEHIPVEINGDKGMLSVFYTAPIERYERLLEQYNQMTREKYDAKSR